MIISFQQCVAMHGYQIVTDPEGFLHDFLVARDNQVPGTLIIKAFLEGDSLSPLDKVTGKIPMPFRIVDFSIHSGLARAFTRFAAIKHQDDIIEFANKFGPLGLEQQVDDFAGRVSAIGGVLANPDLREPIVEWITAARKFQWLIEVKRAKAKHDLRTLFETGNQQFIYNRINPHHPFSDKAKADQAIDELWDCINLPHDVNATGEGEHLLTIIWHDINLQLARYISPVFQAGRRFVLQAHNLHAALWAEMARFYASEVEYHQCEYEGCKDWFRVGGEGDSPKQRRYCPEKYGIKDYCSKKANNGKRSTTIAGRQKGRIDGQHLR